MTERGPVDEAGFAANLFASEGQGFGWRLSFEDVGDLILAEWIDVFVDEQEEFLREVEERERCCRGHGACVCLFRGDKSCSLRMKDGGIVKLFR